GPAGPTALTKRPHERLGGVALHNGRAAAGPPPAINRQPVLAGADTGQVAKVARVRRGDPQPRKYAATIKMSHVSVVREANLAWQIVAGAELAADECSTSKRLACERAALDLVSANTVGFKLLHQLQPGHVHVLEIDCAREHAIRAD